MGQTRGVLAELLEAASLTAITVVAETSKTLRPFLVGVTLELEPILVPLERENVHGAYAEHLLREVPELLVAAFVSEGSFWNFQDDELVTQDIISVQGTGRGIEAVTLTYYVDREAPLGDRERVRIGAGGLDAAQPSWLSSLISTRV